MADWIFTQTSDEQGLRLIVSFLQIKDDEARELIIHLTEKMLASQTAAEQLPPFPMHDLQQDNLP